MTTPRKAPLPSLGGVVPRESLAPSASAAGASASAASAAAAASDASGSSVQVVVRCRPPSDKEKGSNDTMVVGCYPQHAEVRVITNGKKSTTSSAGAATMQAQANKADANTKTYTFDQTYGALSTQEEVYNQSVKPLVEEVLGGFNCTVFAYGQTGTGKTHSMVGEIDSKCVTDQSGVIPRSIHTIFEQLTSGKYEDYSVKVSFLELYNEELADLLSDYEDKPTSGSSTMGAPPSSSASAGDDKKELRIFEDPTGKKGMCVNNLEEALVPTAAAFFTLLTKANRNRKVAETNLNARSSRSHYVVTVTVHTKEYSEDGEDIIKTGKLYLVDLAGSECIGKSGATDKRAKEAGKINQSLLTLGRVINALVDRASFIPYRDSKLTRLLQESLGGRAKTLILATVSPSLAAFDETLSTLDYAHRAKSIKNKPQVNAKMTKRAYMKELLAEIALLKRDNEVLRTKNGIIIAPERYERMMAEEKGKTMAIDELMYKIATQQKSLDAVQATLTEKEELLSATLEAKSAVELTLTQTLEMLESTRAILATTKSQLDASQELLLQFQRRLYATQVELEHSTALVDAQRATEYRLTLQAIDVITALETTLDQKQALHDKVDRKATVESHNAQATQKYAAATMHGLDSMHNVQHAMQTDAAKKIEEHSAALKAEAQSAESFARSMEESASSSNAANTASHAALVTEVGAFHGVHSKAITAAEASSTQFHDQRSAHFAAAQKESGAAFSAISADAAAIKAASAAQFAKAQANAEQTQATTASFVQRDIVPAIAAIDQAAGAHSVQAVADSLATAEKLAALQSAQHTRVATDAEKLHARIAQMQADNAARIAAITAANLAAIAQLQATQAAAAAAQTAAQIQLREEQAAAHAKIEVAQNAALAKMKAEQDAVHAAQIAAQTQFRAEQIAAQEQRIAAQSKLQEEQVAAQAQIQSAHASALAQMKAQQAAAHEAQLAEQAAFRAQQVAAQEARTAAQARLQEEQSGAEAQIRAEQAAAFAKMQADQAAALAEQSAAHAKMHAEHAALIARMQAEQIAAQEAQAAAQSKMQSEQAAEIARMQSTLAEASKAQAAAQLQLRSEQSEAQSALVAAQSKLQKDQSETTLQIHAAQAAALAEMQAAQIAAAKAQAVAQEKLRGEQAALEAAEMAAQEKLQQEQAAAIVQIQLQQAAELAAMQVEQTAAHEAQALAQAQLLSAQCAASAQMQVSMVSSATQLQDSLVRSVHEMQSILAEQVNQLIDAHKDGQIAEVEANVAALSAWAVKMSEVEAAASSVRAASIVSVTQVATQFVSKMRAQSEALSAQATADHTAIVAQQTALATRVQQSQSAHHMQLDTCIESNAARRSEAAQESSVLASLAGEFLQAQTRAIEAAQSQCVQQGEATLAAAGAYRARMESGSAQLLAQSAGVHATLQQFGSEFEASVSQSRSTLNRYVEADLTADQPLGTTPQKSAPRIRYPSQSDLAKTADAASVVRSYRAAGHPQKPLVLQGMLGVIEGIEEMIPIVPEAAEESAAAVAADAPAAAVAEPKRISGAVAPAPAAADAAEHDGENIKPAANVSPAAVVASADLAEKPTAAAASAAAVSAAPVPAPGHKRVASGASKLPIAAASAASLAAPAKAPATRVGSRLRAPSSLDAK